MNTRRSFIKKTVGTSLLFGTGVMVSSIAAPAAPSGGCPAGYNNGGWGQRSGICYYTCNNGPIPPNSWKSCGSMTAYNPTSTTACCETISYGDIN